MKTWRNPEIAYVYLLTDGYLQKDSIKAETIMLVELDEIVEQM